MRQFFIEEPPESFDPEVRAYLTRQMTLIQDALQSIYAIDADEVKPAKIQNGLIQYAESGDKSQFESGGLWLYHGEWVRLNDQYTSPYGACGEFPLNILTCGNPINQSIYADGKAIIFQDKFGNKSDLVNLPPYVPEDIYNPDGSFPLEVGGTSYKNSLYQSGGYFGANDSQGRQHTLSTYLHDGGIFVQNGDTEAKTGLYSLTDVKGSRSQRLIYNNQIASFPSIADGALGVVPRMHGLTIDIVNATPSSSIPAGTIVMWDFGSLGVRPAVHQGGGNWEALAFYSDT